MATGSEMIAELADYIARLEAENDRLAAELKHRDDYNARVPDPRRHKYFDAECSGGCKSLTYQNEIKRLASVVERLPKTADGVPVVPGETVWTLEGATPQPLTVHWDLWCYVQNEDGELDEESEAWCGVSHAWSTSEAAEQAGKENSDG